MDDPVKLIGLRIRDARVRKNFKSSNELAAALRRRGGDKGFGNETVRLWETGHHAPPYEALEILSLELDEPAEYILFGIRADQQLRKEQRFLDYVSEEELALLTPFRRTSKEGRAIVIDSANSAAKRYPLAEEPERAEHRRHKVKSRVR